MSPGFMRGDTGGLANEAYFFRNHSLVDFFFFLSNDLHILQTTCITNKNITKNTI